MAEIRKRVGKKGVSWFVQVRKKGHETQRKTFKSKADAKSWAADVERDMAGGKRFSGSQHTLAWIIDEYIEQADLTTNVQNILKWWKKRLGDKKISDLHAEDFLEARRALLKMKVTSGKRKGETLSASTINKRMAYVSAALTWGHHEYPRVIEKNHPAQITALEVDNKRDPLAAGWTDAHGEAIVKAAREHREPAIYLMVLLGMATGARAGELVGLDWSDVTLHEDRAVLRFMDTKNGTSRGVPIAGLAFEELKKFPRHDLAPQVLWNTQNKRGGIVPIRYHYRLHWDEVRKAAGCDDFTFHDLRHVAASTLAQKGVPLNMIGEVLGHKSAQMTARYSHYSTDALNPLADLLAENIR